jgi:hypothetical protein
LEAFEHLRFTHLDPVNAKRKKPRPPKREFPADPPAHARKLLEGLARTAEAQRVAPGFDPRLMLKLEVEGITPELLESIPGLQLVSQEAKTVSVVFVSSAAKAEFERRLRMLTRGQTPTRVDVLFAIKGVEGWQREDRLGWALRVEGFPETAAFLLDVELWPLERGDERNTMLSSFTRWAQARQMEVVDTLLSETVVLARVRTTTAGAEELLAYRDVRMVELPPRLHLDLDLVGVPLQQLPPVEAPPVNAPRVAVLDSGIASGHPLLGPAVGDAVSFLAGRGPEDENGHGTRVAGLALYGDVAQRAQARSFVPELWLLSGRVTNELNEAEQLIEKQIIAAVESFVTVYGCRIFNLSLGDQRRPYTSGHIGPWASVLDELARHHGILFVVSAGNFLGSAAAQTDWLAGYPDYLLSDEARIIDPAPALNALTVGSLARHERSRMAVRVPADPAYRPIARAGEPSPFTRSGPSIGGAVKPELAEYGGNWYVEGRVSNAKPQGYSELGELSTAHDFMPGTGGNLFGVGAGTSYAAPRVTWLAGMLAKKYPQASANLLRALLVAHASVPAAASERLGSDDRVLKVVGYGQPDAEAALSSTERRVTLVAESHLPNNSYHFYEIVLPDDFVRAPHHRPRRITVALAHMPIVRRTRLDYRGSTFAFRVVRDVDPENVFRIFQRANPKEKQLEMPNEAAFKPGSHARGGGTVQTATWEIRRTSADWARKKLFVVVSRSVPEWAALKLPEEPYALTVVLEDRSAEPVRLYTQLRDRLRDRERARVRF